MHDSSGKLCGAKEAGKLSAKFEHEVQAGSASRWAAWRVVQSGNRKYVQEKPMSPLLLVTLLKRVMEQTECTTDTAGLKIHGMWMKDLR